MAKGHQLKLNSYSIILRKHNEKKKTKSEVMFSDFFETFRNVYDKKVTQNTLFNRFYKYYLESFNEEFVKDKDGTKAYSPGDSIVRNPANCLIDGIFEGGLTGIEQSVQDQRRKKAKSKITKDDVAALPFYFLLWFPSDVNYGVIMIQSYGSSTINSLVIKHMKKVFKSKGFTFDEQMCITEKDKDDFLKHSVVQELSFLSTFESKDTGGDFSALMGGSETFQVEVRIKKINTNTTSFLNNIGNLQRKITEYVKIKVNGAKKIGASEPKAFYKGEKTRSHALINDHRDFIPSLVLNNDIKETGKETPDLDKIRKFSKAYLKEIQEERGYKSRHISR